MIGHRLGPTSRRWVFIGASFAAAIILSIMPGPAWAEPFRPDWVDLVLIYWCLALPQRVGIGIGWTAGLVLDVLYGSLLGQQALAKALIAFITLKLHLQIRMFPRWQQAVTVFVLIALSDLLVFWIRGATGHAVNTWTYWVPSLVSMALWPWIFVILRDIRRRAHLT